MSSANLPAKTARPQDVAPAPVDVVAMDKMASAVARSGLFALTEPQAFTLMLLAHSRGLHPAQAFERYHVINNRPSMKADAMLAEFQANGGVVTWAQHDDDACEATFECPGVGSPVTITWTREDAKRAQLLRNPMWDKYPRQMLRARVISEGVRMCMPGITIGIYTEEEARDIVVTERPPAPAPSPPVTPPQAQPSAKADGPASGHVITEIEDRCRAVEARFAKEHPDAIPLTINRHRVERGVVKDLTGKSTEGVKAGTVRAKLVELAESRWPEVSVRIWVRIRDQYEAAKEVVRMASEAAAKQAREASGDAESLGDGAVDADYDDGLDGTEAGLSG